MVILLVSLNFEVNLHLNLIKNISFKNLRNYEKLIINDVI